MPRLAAGKSVAFIIPVRHPANARDWPRLIERLSETMRSISAQRSPDWLCVIVANREAQLPELPAGFFAVRVDLPPNPLYEMDHSNREAIYEAVRTDKGRRVLAGMLAARGARFFMVVDDDDFVSRDIVSFAEGQPDLPGWYVDHGYLWSEGSSFLMRQSGFNTLCGTSHLVRADLYELPERAEDAPIDWVKAMMGSHIKIESILRARGCALEPLPFAGAIYRVGHGEAHSRSKGVLRAHLLNRETLSHPRRLLRNALALRRLDYARRAQFGMEM
ncbi:glycosyltransferase family A protein [Rhizobium sp. SGZ-381]|uniref:glycosyltransferase family A protein n=1 Tax=Rhizobium sp. SGZ-381 TaxID=3342800 RepID=UPI0036728DD1